MSGNFFKKNRSEDILNFVILRFRKLFFKIKSLIKRETKKIKKIPQTVLENIF